MLLPLALIALAVFVLPIHLKGTGFYIVYGPIGVCVWGGAGSIFDSHKNFDASKILPNAGVGLRFAVAGQTALRIDYGFGRHSQGLIINVNEAF